MKRATLCRCPDCAELDLAFPGEGQQLAFPALAPKPAKRAPRRRASATVEMVSVS